METKTETKPAAKAPVPAVPATLPDNVSGMPSAALSALLHNDWSKVTPGEELRYTQALCASLSIPTPLNPFRLITLSGKKVLYAGAEVTRLLAERNVLSIQIIKIYTEKETNIHTVEVRAIQRDGRYTDDIGSIYVGGLSGQKLADAKMKCITKAKRRVVLSFCGLSVLDDEDVTEMSKQTAAAGYGPVIDGDSQVMRATVTEAPAPFVDAPKDETEELRRELFKRMTDGRGWTAKAANAYIENTTSKKFTDLTANDCVDILAIMDEEDEATEPESEEKQPDTQAKTDGDPSLFGNPSGQQG